MFDLNNLNLALSIVGGTVIVLLQFAGIIWKLSKVESTIHERITSVERETESHLAELQKKILEMELRISENYLKKDSFRLVTEKIDQHLIRLEAKLDAAIART